MPACSNHINRNVKAILLVLALLLTATTPVYGFDITVGWDKNTEVELRGYKVYYKTGSEGAPYNGTGADQGASPITISLDDLDDPDNPTYEVTGLDDQLCYYFVVTAYSDGTSEDSGYSNEVDECLEDDLTAPQITASPSVSAKTNTTATVEWTTNESADGRVEYGVGTSTWGNYPSSQNDTSLTTSHSMELTGLQPLTAYYLRVGSTDGSGNGPTTSSEISFTTNPNPDTDPPSILEFPAINYGNNTIDITYDEANLQNVTTETNYTFSPTVLFASLGGSDDIANTTGNTYRLTFGYIPSFTILNLTLQNVTDQAGNPLSPNSIKINDNDDDGMADDWESAKGLDPNDPGDTVDDPDGDGLSISQEFNAGGTTSTDPNNADTDGDGMDDGWETTYGVSPLVDDAAEDADSDGWTNFQEYASGTNPNSAASKPIHVKETIPHENLANDPTATIPVDASLAFRIEASAAVNLTNQNDVVFHINEAGSPVYERNLGDPSVKVTKLLAEPDTSVSKLWIEYDRSSDSQLAAAYDYDTEVGVSVYVKDKAGSELESQSVRFKTQTQADHQSEQLALPPTTTVNSQGSSTHVIMLDERAFEDESLRGARILFNGEDGGVTPYFGPLDVVPTLSVSGSEGQGIPLNLKPPRTFPSGVTLFLPYYTAAGVQGLCVYGYNGLQWELVCDESGNIRAAGEGWLIPEWNNGKSRAVLDTANLSGITVWVRHFSSFAVGEPGLAGTGGGTINGGSSGSSYGSLDAANLSDGGGTGGCFISTLTTQ
jgi:hypothetical protein